MRWSSVAESKIVAKNFSRNPTYYHKNATTQFYVANKLANLISARSTKRTKKILEIGCGTGFLTEQLFHLYPESTFLITDISEAMLQYCKKHTEASRAQLSITANFAKMDISNACLKDNFNLIVSSLVFQWINDFDKFIQHLYSQLADNGMLIFSTLSPGTFTSVKQIFNEINIPFPMPKLWTPEKIKSACKDFDHIELHEELRVENFDSIHLFLKHIQGTGAGNASGKHITPAELKTIVHSTLSNIPSEYNITYLVCQKS